MSANYDLTYWTIQHRYLKGPNAYAEDADGWTFSSFNNIASPARGSILTPNGGRGFLTEEEGRRGLETVRQFHRDYPPDPRVSDHYGNLPQRTRRLHEPAEFRLVKVQTTRSIEPVDEQRFPRRIAIRTRKEPAHA
jgi:hypothetical protein